MRRRVTYAIGPWEWQTGGAFPYWRAPDDCAGCLDLRSIPQQSIAGGTPEGYGIFALRESAPPPGSSYRLLGNSLDARLSSEVRGIVGDQLRVGAIASFRLDLIMNELLTVKADHTGETFARPLMPQMNRQMHISLAGQRVHSERFRHDSIQHQATILQMHEQYRTNRLKESKGELPPGHHLKILGFTVNKFGDVPWQEFVPPEFVNDPGPERPETTITESFNKEDSATLGPDLVWIEDQGNIDIVNNEAKMVTGAPALARATSVLSSDDHYVQGVMSIARKSTGTLCRVADANNLYLGRVDLTAFTDTEIYKRVTGTWSQIHDAVNDTASTWGDTDTLKTDANGSTLKVYRNGTQEGSVADTALTGTVTTGFSFGVTAGVLDDFAAADLAVGGTTSHTIGGGVGSGSGEGGYLIGA